MLYIDKRFSEASGKIIKERFRDLALFLKFKRKAALR
jgi:hypothetical protein